MKKIFLILFIILNLAILLACTSSNFEKEHYNDQIPESILEDNDEITLEGANPSHVTIEAEKESEMVEKWITFRDEDFGFSFDYPESFGGAKIEIHEGEDGKNWYVDFEGQEGVLMLGGATSDFAIPIGKLSLFWIDEIIKRDDGNYEIIYGQSFNVTPYKLIQNASNEEVPVLNYESIPELIGVEGPLSSIRPPDDGLIAYIILKDEEFHYVAVMTENFEKFSEEDFFRLLRSFEVF